jgi:GNAT superfamily N-acetyltransferase
MSIEFVVQLAPFDRELIRELSLLAQSIFDEPDLGVEWRLTCMPDASATLARVQQRVIAFKLGYAVAESKYCSWLCGVEQSSRGQGIARQLTRLQHQCAHARGYTTLETSADRTNAAMSRINLQEGYRVCGARSEPHRMQILYLKSLR